jgi:hypothetical protein
MRRRKHQITALLYASAFAVVAGAALHFFARASMVASILAAAILLGVTFFALLESER